jgi:survival of motor neuron protein-interacting protein 1
MKRKRLDDDDDNDNNNNNNNNKISFDDVDAMEASEYLQRVAQQARGIPDTSLVASPKTPQSSHKSHYEVLDGSAASLQYLLSTHFPRPKERIQHETAWINQALKKFVQLREYLDLCHQQGVGGKGHRFLAAVPSMKDRAGWIQFCTGHVEEATDDDEAATSAAWRETLPPEGYHNPLVQLVCQLDQVMIRRVLQHLASSSQLTGSSFYLWCYALLARLETPLHRQDAATLRKLVVNVAQIRAACSDNRAAKNLLLVAAGLYFGQASRHELFPTI